MQSKNLHWSRALTLLATIVSVISLVMIIFYYKTMFNDKENNEIIALEETVEDFVRYAKVIDVCLQEFNPKNINNTTALVQSDKIKCELYNPNFDTDIMAEASRSIRNKLNEMSSHISAEIYFRTHLVQINSLYKNAWAKKIIEELNNDFIKVSNSYSSSGIDLDKYKNALDLLDAHIHR